MNIDGIPITRGMVAAAILLLIVVWASLIFLGSVA